MIETINHIYELHFLLKTCFCCMYIMLFITKYTHLEWCFEV